MSHIQTPPEVQAQVDADPDLNRHYLNALRNEANRAEYHRQCMRRFEGVHLSGLEPAPFTPRSAERLLEVAREAQRADQEYAASPKGRYLDVCRRMVDANLSAAQSIDAAESAARRGLATNGASAERDLEGAAAAARRTLRHVETALAIVREVAATVPAAKTLRRAEAA